MRVLVTHPRRRPRWLALLAVGAALVAFWALVASLLWAVLV